MELLIWLTFKMKKMNRSHYYFAKIIINQKFDQVCNFINKNIKIQNFNVMIILNFSENSFIILA